MTFDITDHWHDPVAVNRYLAGRAPGRRLTHPERVAVYRALRDHPEDHPNASLAGLRASAKEMRRIRAEAETA